MKTILLTITAFILLSAFGTSASLTAFPIDLKLNPSAMYLVEITNINTGVTLEQYTDVNGFLHIEWANIDDAVSYTNSFKATVGGRDYPLTSFMDGIDETISVTGVDCIPQVKEVPVEKIVYQDKNVYVCSDGSTRATNDCPVSQPITAEELAGAIVLIILGMGAYKYGFGIKIYTKTDGTVELQHKHRNVSGYHSINIMHKIQPHKKGQLKVSYDMVKGADGYYKYIG